MTSAATLTLRASTAADTAALTRLAALDSQLLGSGSYLVAETSAGLVAAVSERDGHAIGDPFQLSAHAVELLRSWRGQRVAERTSARPKAGRLGLRLVAARAL
jgi:hypothetical protein